MYFGRCGSLFDFFSFQYYLDSTRMVFLLRVKKSQLPKFFNQKSLVLSLLNFNIFLSKFKSVRVVNYFVIFLSHAQNFQIDELRMLSRTASKDDLLSFTSRVDISTSSSLPQTPLSNNSFYSNRTPGTSTPLMQTPFSLIPETPTSGTPPSLATLRSGGKMQSMPDLASVRASNCVRPISLSVDAQLFSPLAVEDIIPVFREDEFFSGSDEVRDVFFLLFPNKPKNDCASALSQVRICVRVKWLNFYFLIG
jgi:hypothetical protein